MSTQNVCYETTCTYIEREKERERGGEREYTCRKGRKIKNAILVQYFHMNMYTHYMRIRVHLFYFIFSDVLRKLNIQLSSLVSLAPPTFTNDRRPHQRRLLAQRLHLTLPTHHLSCRRPRTSRCQ